MADYLDKRQANYSPLNPIQFLTRSAEVYPNTVSVIYGDTQYTWSQTYARCKQLASALQQIGVKKGDTVSFLAANTPELYEAHFGVPMLGAVLNAINCRLDAETITYILEHSQAKVLFCDTAFSETATKAIAALNREIVLIDIDDPAVVDGQLIGSQDYQAFISSGDPDFNDFAQIDEWDNLALNYTSGTTGRPKGVLYHYRGAYLTAISNILEWDMPKHPTYLWTLPMFHCNGWCFPWSIAARAGTNVCLRKVSGAHIFGAIAANKVDHFCGAPIVLSMVINARDDERREFDHQCKVMTAAAPPPASVLQKMQQQGFVVTHVYGLTETYGPATVCAWQPAWDKLSIAQQAVQNARQGVNYLAAVTGTNGKSSVADFTRQLWTHLGLQAASLGTLGLVAPDRIEPGGLTTPDAADLHATLAALAAGGVDHAAIEASSHGLDQFRLDGVRIGIAAFTNISRDHLDYHGSMDAYRDAKARLFTELLQDGGTAVLNADDPYSQKLLAGRDIRAMTYGKAGRDIRLLDCQPHGQGQRITLNVMGQDAEIDFPLIGDFQVMNALCAAAMVIADGADPQIALQAIEKLEPVAGRMQLAARLANGAAVYVDYAHTPDALRRLLQALRPHTEAALGVVFGCGGDRDIGKRPEMGAIAAELADRTIVTDDNPRSEDAARIRAAILAAATGASEIGAREDAIFEAVRGLAPGDILVIAGKGHEQGQIIGGETIPFDDVEVAMRAAAEVDR